MLSFANETAARIDQLVRNVNIYEGQAAYGCSAETRKLIDSMNAEIEALRATL